MQSHRFLKPLLALAAFFSCWTFASAQQGVSSISLSKTTVDPNESLNVTAYMNQQGMQVSGSLVILFHLSGSTTTETVYHSLSGYMPSSVTKSYTPTIPGVYTVEAFVGGVYWPSGSPYPVGFSETPCPSKSLTVTPPASSGLPGTTPLGLTVPAGWTDLVKADASKTTAVGATVGELSVGASGEATYSVPLWTTPGTSGMQPELSLNYSSRGGNGLLGQGWSLSGLSAVTRGPKTQAIDGYVAGVNYAKSDAYYLDGQRLILVSGTYGNSGSEYRTKMESFSKIVFTAADSYGPTRVEVKTKSGLTMEYGNGSNSARLATGRTGTMSWHVNKITDAAGNYMSYSYTFNSSTGEHYLNRIDYTGNSAAGLSPYASVRLEYASRSDTSTGYANGVKVATLKRLSAVKVYYSSTLVRTYAFGYVATGSASRSQLSTLTETGKDGVSYDGLVFGYSGSAYNSGSWSSDNTKKPPFPLTRDDKANGTGFMDVNGDGYPDFVYARSGSSNYTYLNTPAGWSYSSAYSLPSNAKLANSDGKDQGLRFVDFDGDGLVDFMLGNGGSVTYAYRNTGSGWAYTSSWNIPTFIRGTADPDEAHRYFIDVNGDGRVDFVYNNGGSYKGAYVNTGSGWSYQSQWTPQLENSWAKHAIFVDVNGDGLPDQVAHQNDDRTQYGVALNTGSGWNLYTSGSTYSKYLPPLPIARYHSSTFGANTLDIYGVEVVDVNGDGLSDLVYADNFASSTFRTYLNKGYGWVEDTTYRSQIQFGERGPNRGAAVVDVNGDGLPDFTTFEGTSTSYKKTQYNTGDGMSSVHTYNGLPYQMDEYTGSSYRNSGAQLVDLDADGFVDQPYNRGNSSGTSVAGGAYINNISEPRHLLKTVTNAFGVVARIEYAPITERTGLNAYTFYQKSSSSLPAGQANVVGPMYVVKKLKHENGIGGTYEVDYSYKGLRTDRLHGNVGFQEIAVSDSNTGMRTTTTFSQVWPHVGTPIAGKVEYDLGSSWRTVSESSSTLSTAYYNSNKTVVPYVSVANETSYDPENGTTVLKKVKTTTGQLDSYGNVGFVEVDTTGADGKTHRKSTVSTYWNDSANWHLGRLLESTTDTEYWDTVSGSYKTDSRTSAWLYHSSTDIANGKIKGMLSQEIIDPDAYDIAILFPQYATSDYLVTSYKYDAYGNVIRKDLYGHGLSGRFSKSDYDSQGRLLDWSENAKGHRTTYSQNQYWGKPNSVTDPNGLVSSFLYDGFGRTIKVTAPDGNISEVRRRWAGWAAPASAKYLVEKETQGAPPSVEFYDKYGRVIEAYGVNPGGTDGVVRIVGSRTDYDNQSRAYRSYNPFYLGAAPVLAQEKIFDGYGRLQQVKIRDDAAVGGWGITDYDYVGLTTLSTNPKGQQTHTTVDYQGNKTKVVTNAMGSGAQKGEVRYDYDGFGQLLRTRVFNDNGDIATTSFVYDGRGRKVSMTDPDMGTWTYSYNAAGELVSQKDARNLTTTMAYDALGRMVSKSDADGTSTWLYDSCPWDTRKGFLYAVTGPAVTRDGLQQRYIQNLEYDGYGRLSKSTQFMNWPVTTVNYPTTHTYDSNGRPSVMTYPNGFKVRNVYSAYGFLDQVKEEGGSNTVYWRAKSYDVRGNLTRFDMGNGLNVRREFDTLTGRLEKIDSGSTGSSSSIMNLDYTYDSLGNVASRSNQYGSYLEFAYDGLNRMTFSGIAGIGGSTYTYDALGNIKTKAGVAGTYQYHATKKHAVTAAGGYSYTYDANGNRSDKKSGSTTVMSMSWDAGNKLYKIQKGSQKTLFWMDPTGQRFAQSDTSNGTTHYVGSHYEVVWDAFNTSGGTRRKCYVNTPSGRTAVRTTYDSGQWAGQTKIRYFHQDNIGSIYAVTTENGTIEQRMKYDPWGKQTVTLDNSGNTRPRGVTDRGYTDHEMMSDYGLIHMNGRVYDYELGRFCSADPFVQDAQDSQAYNRMSYVGNNPMTYSDPSGFFSLKDALKIVAVVAISFMAVKFAIGKWGATLEGLKGAKLAGAMIKNGAIGGAAAGFAGGFSGTLLNGGSIGAAFKSGLKGGIRGGITGAISGGIGFKFGDVGNLANEFRRALAHGLTAGAIESAYGGEFMHGFVGGFAGSAAGSAGMKVTDGGTTPSDIAVRTVIAAVAGGLASEAVGGDFANGAATSAFQHLFNKESENLAEIRKEIRLRNNRNHVIRFINGFRSANPDSAIPLTEQMFEALIAYDAYMVSKRGSFVSGFELIGDGDSVFYTRYARARFSLSFDFEGVDAGVYFGGDINYYFQGLLIAHSWNMTMVDFEAHNFLWNTTQATIRPILGVRSDDINQMYRVRKWAYAGRSFYNKNH